MEPLIPYSSFKAPLRQPHIDTKPSKDRIPDVCLRGAPKPHTCDPKPYKIVGYDP